MVPPKGQNLLSQDFFEASQNMFKALASNVSKTSLSDVTSIYEFFGSVVFGWSACACQ